MPAELEGTMATFDGSHSDFEGLLKSGGIDGKADLSASGTGSQRYVLRHKSGAVITLHPNGRVQVQGPEPVRTAMEARLEELLSAGDAESWGTNAGTATPAAASLPPKVFVVHGHDTTAREQLELILHRLGLDPYVLASTGGGGLTIIEALEREISHPSSDVRFGIVLMTPDDFGYSKADGPTAVQPRARQNVILELGMVIAALGRPKVAILRKGHLEMPSDTAGILHIPFNDHVKETVPKLADRLRDAGFPITAADIAKASS